MSPRVQKIAAELNRRRARSERRSARLREDAVDALQGPAPPTVISLRVLTFFSAKMCSVPPGRSGVHEKLRSVPELQ